MQLDALRAHLIRQSGESPDAKIPIPDNYKVMGEWVKEHLAGRLDLLPRAERAASKAEHTEVGMVYRALHPRQRAPGFPDGHGSGQGVPGCARPIRHGLLRVHRQKPRRAGRRCLLRQLSHIGTDQRAFLQFHVVRGNSREDRYCMRIYYFWDEDTNQVVVGWLPSHFSNRIS